MTRTQLNLSVIVVAIGLMAMLAARDGVAWLSLTTDPPPINAPGLNVLIVEESELTDDLPRGQQEILGSFAWRAGWNVRIVDPTDTHPNDLPHWQAAAAKIKDLTLPAFAVSNGRTGTTGSLPATLPEWESLLAKYGGQQ